MDAQQAIEQTHAALRYLAARCNYATSLDNRGYNKFDAQFGHSLAERPALSCKAASAGLKMLRKYQAQLAQAGIELPAEIPAETPAIPSTSAPKGGGQIQLRGTLLDIRFPSIPSERVRGEIKNIRGWAYNPSNHAWSVPLSALAQVCELLPDFALDPTISSALEAEAEAKAIESERQAGITATLLSAVDLSQDFGGKRLYAHQAEGVKKLLRDRRVILADDMGLGKTMTALVAAKAWQEAYGLPVLVVAPKSLRINWLREAEAVGVSIEVFSWAKLPEALSTEFILIADEAHYAQAGAKSARGKAFLALAAAEHCQACYALTGTPIKNGRPSNLYPLLRAVRHPLAQNQRAYEQRYCAARPTRFTQWDTTGASHLDELHARTKDGLLRRLKKDCLDLPPKTRVMVPADPSAEAIATYKAVLSNLREQYHARIAKGEIASEGEVLVMLGHLRHAGSILKVEQALEIAEEILEQGQQVVLFTEFVESAKTLHAKLGGELLIGETVDRQGAVDRFQSGQSRVFVGTIKAGGVGITLTAASTVVLVDRPWTPGDAAQAEDRCHRIGQNSNVTAIWVQHGEIDAKVDAILEQKAERIELVLQGKRKTLRGVGSPTEIARELLEEAFA